MKTCTKCKVEKELTGFYKSKQSIDGFTGQCKGCLDEYREKYVQDHKEEIKEKAKKYRAANKEELKEKAKKYNSSKEGKERKNKWAKERRKTDPLYKLTCNIRCLIGGSIRNGGYSKTSKTADILGCDFELFMKHIERQFKPWMTWDNHGEWEYDHIYPVSKATDEEHLIKLNHYTNFQPLWATDNLSKGNKIEEHQTKLTL